MIRRSFPIFVFLLAAGLVAFMVREGTMPERLNLLGAVLFAGLAAPAIRLFWDKERANRQATIERARKRTTRP